VSATLRPLRFRRRCYRRRVAPRLSNGQRSDHVVQPFSKCSPATWSGATSAADPATSSASLGDNAAMRPAHRGEVGRGLLCDGSWYGGFDEVEADEQRVTDVRRNSPGGLTAALTGRRLRNDPVRFAARARACRSSANAQGSPWGGPAGQFVATELGYVSSPRTAAKSAKNT